MKPRIVLTRGSWAVRMRPHPMPGTKDARLLSEAYKFVYRLNLERSKK